MTPVYGVGAKFPVTISCACDVQAVTWSNLSAGVLASHSSQVGAERRHHLKLLLLMLRQVTSLVTIQVALVTGRVSAHVTAVILLTAMNRHVTFQQRFPTEVPTTLATDVAVAVTPDHVTSQFGLIGKRLTAAFECFIARLVHRGHVTLEVVLAIRLVRALVAAVRS